MEEHIVLLQNILFRALRVHSEEGGTILHWKTLTGIQMQESTTISLHNYDMLTSQQPGGPQSVNTLACF